MIKIIIIKIRSQRSVAPSVAEGSLAAAASEAALPRRLVGLRIVACCILVYYFVNIYIYIYICMCCILNGTVY